MQGEPAHDFSRGMHAVITGSGSALIDPLRGGASAAVIVDGVVLQFDLGRMAMENLTRVGINPIDIDTLFLTHMHFDHIASFGYFVISSWIASRQSILEVCGPPGTKAMAENMVFGGHGADVRFVKGIVQDWPADVPGRPREEAPFTVRELEPGIVLDRPGIKVTAAPVPHYQQYGLMSLAYRVDSRHGSVVISGDCRPSPALRELAQGCDVLIHECAKPDGDMLKSGKLTRNLPNEEPTGGHTTPTWLGQVARDTQTRHVIATHLAPLDSVPAALAFSKVYYGKERPRADIWDEYKRRIQQSYRGRISLAEDAMVVRVE